MKVNAILKSKGRRVSTVRPDETVRGLSQRLRRERVGALIVSSDGARIDGIVSERDVIAAIAMYGAPALDRPVSDLMARRVTTITPDDLVSHAARVMTEHRIRHLPVVEDGALAGIVSLGDVVKHRLDEVELEADVLRDMAIVTH